MAGKLHKACGSGLRLLRSPFAGQARSHRIHAWLESCTKLVGACQGCCAAHSRGKPAPTGFMHGWKAVKILWEHARAAAQPICGASPLPQDSCMAGKLHKSCGSGLVPRMGRAAAPNSQSARAACCSSKISFMPFWASASMALKSSGWNGAPSAVPCTSMKPPALVITTFRSVSAAESSG